MATRAIALVLLVTVLLSGHAVETVRAAASAAAVGTKLTTSDSDSGRNRLYLYEGDADAADAVVEYTDGGEGNFDRKEDVDRVVEFYDPLCGACKALKPSYVKLAKEAAKRKKMTNSEKDLVQFHAVSCRAHHDVCSKFGVNSYPTLLALPAGASKAEHARKVKRSVVGIYTLSTVADALDAAGKAQDKGEDGEGRNADAGDEKEEQGGTDRPSVSRKLQVKDSPRISNANPQRNARTGLTSGAAAGGAAGAAQRTTTRGAGAVAGRGVGVGAAASPRNPAARTIGAGGAGTATSTAVGAAGGTVRAAKARDPITRRAALAGNGDKGSGNGSDKDKDDDDDEDVGDDAGNEEDESKEEEGAKETAGGRTAAAAAAAGRGPTKGLAAAGVGAGTATSTARRTAAAAAAAMDDANRDGRAPREDDTGEDEEEEKENSDDAEGEGGAAARPARFGRGAGAAAAAKRQPARFERTAAKDEDTKSDFADEDEAEARKPARRFGKASPEEKDDDDDDDEVKSEEANDPDVEPKARQARDEKSDEDDDDDAKDDDSKDDDDDDKNNEEPEDSRESDSEPPLAGPPPPGQVRPGAVPNLVPNPARLARTGMQPQDIEKYQAQFARKRVEAARARQAQQGGAGGKRGRAGGPFRPLRNRGGAAGAAQGSDATGDRTPAEQAKIVQERKQRAKELLAKRLELAKKIREQKREQDERRVTSPRQPKPQAYTPIGSKPQNAAAKMLSRMPVVKRMVKKDQPEVELYGDAALSFVSGLKMGLYNDDRPLDAKRQKALVDWLELLSVSLPPELGLHFLIDDLLNNVNYISQKRDNLYKQLDRHPLANKFWSDSCSKGKSGQGHNCGLWKLLHIMSVGFAEQRGGLELDSSARTFTPSEAAGVVREYIALFFGCAVCRNNFLSKFDDCYSFRRCDRMPEETAIDDVEEDDWREFPLWLWEFHNHISVRIVQVKAKRDSAASGTPKNDDEVIGVWPAMDDCLMCYREDGSWNLDELHHFLEKTYWHASSTDFEKDRALKEYEHTTRRGVSAGRKSSFTSFFGFIGLVLLVLYVVKRRKVLLSGFSKRYDANPFGARAAAAGKKA